MYELVVFFKRVTYLFLVIHEFLLFVLEKDPPVNAKDEGGGIKLAIVVILRVGVFWREGLSLELGAEQKFYIIFG